MGNFSWCTSDTRKSVPCFLEYYDGAPKTVYLLNPFGDAYKETAYEGYGVFGGRDVYELVVEWNREFLSSDLISKPDRKQWRQDDVGEHGYAVAIEKYNAFCAAVNDYVAGKPDNYIQEKYGSIIAYGDGSDWKRCLGIQLAGREENHVKLRYPIKIVENVCDYDKAGISPACPFQGMGYEEMFLSQMQQGIDREFEKLLKAEGAYADEKADVLDDFFSAQKMDDCYVSETFPHLIVLDDEGNQWIDKEIFEFVLDECLAFDQDGRLLDGLGAAEPFAEKLKQFALSYGVKPTPCGPSLNQKIAEAQALKNELVSYQPSKENEKEI